MIKKIKNWIINKFLPAYAKQILLERNQKLEKKNEELLTQIEVLKAYINGLEAGTRNRIKIINKYFDKPGDDN